MSETSFANLHGSGLPALGCDLFLLCFLSPKNAFALRSRRPTFCFVTSARLLLITPYIALNLFFRRFFLFFSSQATKLNSMSPGDFLEAKQLGYSDIQISQRTGAKENEVWN